MSRDEALLIQAYLKLAENYAESKQAVAKLDRQSDPETVIPIDVFKQVNESLYDAILELT